MKISSETISYLKRALPPLRELPDGALLGAQLEVHDYLDNIVIVVNPSGCEVVQGLPGVTCRQWLSENAQAVDLVEPEAQWVLIRDLSGQVLVLYEALSPHLVRAAARKRNAAD